MCINKVPTISYWVEELDTFKWWKKRRRKRYFRVALLILILNLFVSVGSIVFEAQPADVEDIIFGSIGTVAFFLLAIYFLYKWVKISSLSPTDAIRVTVIEKSRYSKRRSKRYDNRAYYVIAKVDGKRLEGLCEVETYRAVQPGDSVVFFRMNSKQYFAIHS